MSAGSVLGIDFGTTNSSAAYFDATGRLRLVPIGDKRFTLPSVAWFRAADKVVVGQAARTQIVDDPAHTLYEVKRFLGRRYQSEFVQRNRGRYGFEVLEGAEGAPSVEMYGRIVPIEEVATRVIAQLLDHANHAAGVPFRQCVIAVPTHAGHRQREATRRAAQAAGLEVRALVNEPTAAALYYANLKTALQTVLVFDLGGGTLDATLMSVDKRTVRVLATGGDAFLGGSDFDSAIGATLIERFHAAHGIDLREQKIVVQRLLFAAESAKIALSAKESVRLHLPCVVPGPDGRFLDLDVLLTRAEVEGMVEPLVERAIGTCGEVLERAKVSVEAIDELVLVGGQTRWPAIRRKLSRFRKLSAERDVPADLAVAVGAAVLGRNLARGARGLADVVAMPVSVMMPGGRSHVVVAANTPVPCACRVSLESLPSWTALIPILIFESVDETSVERDAIGTVQIPPGWRQSQLRGKPELELAISADFVLTATLVSTAGERVDAPVQRAR